MLTQAQKDSFKSLSSREIHKFITRIKGGVIKYSDFEDPAEASRYCADLLKQRYRARFGDWDKAKVEFAHLPDWGLSGSQDLPPIMGYPCHYSEGDFGSCIYLINPLLGIAYQKITSVPERKGGALNILKG